MGWFTRFIAWLERLDEQDGDFVICLIWALMTVFMLLAVCAINACI